MVLSMVGRVVRSISRVCIRRVRRAIRTWEMRAPSRVVIRMIRIPAKRIITVMSNISVVVIRGISVRSRRIIRRGFRRVHRRIPMATRVTTHRGIGSVHNIRTRIHPRRPSRLWSSVRMAVVRNRSQMVQCIGQRVVAFCTTFGLGVRTKVRAGGINTRHTRKRRVATRAAVIRGGGVSQRSRIVQTRNVVARNVGRNSRIPCV